MTSPTRDRSHRDLASLDIWEHSLDRSRRRRVLAEDARRTIARRKHASLAVSAAMAATPIVPSVIASAMSGSKKGTTNTRKLNADQGHNRVLLKLGAVSPSVAEVQRKLQIADDGYYGPVTQQAVRAFQKRNHLAATGKIDIKTWLKLFPEGMILYAPHSGMAQLATQAPASAVADTSGQTADASLTTASAGSAAKDTSSGKAHVASLKLKAAGGAPNTKLPSTGAPSGPSGGAAAGTLPSAGSGGGGGGGSTGGGGGSGGGGSTVVPHGPLTSAGEMIAAMIAEANNIDAHHYSYRWGGGHANFSGPYDCSGAVSAVLHAAGLLGRPLVSGDFAHWGRPGRGAVTLYANAGHVYMSILGRYFGTSSANPGGGAGWFNGGPRPGFVVVHVPFESMHFSHKTRVKMAKLFKASRHKRQVAQQQPSDESAASYQSVTPGYHGQAPGAADSGSSDSGSSSGSGTVSDGTTQAGTQQSTYGSDGSTASAGTQQASTGAGDQSASSGTSDGSTAATGQAPATAASQAPASSSSGASDGSASSSYGGSSASSGSSGSSSGASSSGASDSYSGSQSSGSSGSGSSGSGSSGSGSGSSSGSTSSAGPSSGSSGSSGQGSSGSAGSAVSGEQQSATASSTASSASSSASSAAGDAQGATGSAPGSGSSGSGSGSSGSGSYGSGK